MASSTRSIQSIFEALNIFPGQQGLTSIVLEYLAADNCPQYILDCYNKTSTHNHLWAKKIAEYCLMLLEQEPDEENQESKEQKKPALAEGVANALSEIEEKDRLILFGRWNELAKKEEEDEYNEIPCSRYRFLIAYFLPVPQLAPEFKGEYEIEKVRQYLQDLKAPQEKTVLQNQVVHQEEVPSLALDLTQGLTPPEVSDDFEEKLTVPEAKVAALGLDLTQRPAPPEGQDGFEKKLIVPEALVHVLRIKIALAENNHGTAKALMRESSRHLNISGALLSGVEYGDCFFFYLNLSSACLESVIFKVPHLLVWPNPNLLNSLSLKGANLCGMKIITHHFPVSLYFGNANFINKFASAKKGLEIRIGSGEGWLRTPLYDMAILDKWTEFGMLLEAGADPGVTAYGSITLASLLVQKGSSDSRSAFRLLINSLKEADLNSEITLSKKFLKNSWLQLMWSVLGILALVGGECLSVLGTQAFIQLITNIATGAVPGPGQWLALAYAVGGTTVTCLSAMFPVALIYMLFTHLPNTVAEVRHHYENNKFITAIKPSTTPQTAPSPTRSHAPQVSLDAASTGRAPAVTPGTVSTIGLTGSAQAKAPRDTGVGIGRLSPPSSPR